MPPEKPGVYVVAERLQQLVSRLCRTAVTQSGSIEPASRTMIQQADAQPARVGAELIDVGPSPAAARSRCHRRRGRARRRAIRAVSRTVRLTQSSTD